MSRDDISLPKYFDCCYAYILSWTCFSVRKSMASGFFCFFADVCTKLKDRTLIEETDDQKVVLCQAAILYDKYVMYSLPVSLSVFIL